MERRNLTFVRDAICVTRRALAALPLLALGGARGARGDDIVSHATTTLTVNGKPETFTLDDLRAMRDALAAYLAEHPPETRTTLPPNWRNSLPPPKGEPVIDADGARVPPWGLGRTVAGDAPVLAIRWTGPQGGGGYIVEARLQRLPSGWSVVGLGWVVVRPLGR